MGLEKYELHCEKFSDWLMSLKEMSHDKWLSPIAEGKWSIAAIVSHLMFWDQHILSHKIPKLKESAAIEGYPNFDSQNHTAKEYAHSGISKEQLIDEILDERIRYRNFLHSLTEEDLSMTFTIGGHLHTMEEFLLDFLQHDLHHQKQIIAALEEVEVIN